MEDTDGLGDNARSDEQIERATDAETERPQRGERIEIEANDSLPFHQRQELRLCGLHVVNNLLQVKPEDFYKRNIMDDIAQQLFAEEKLINEKLKISPYSSSDGDYHIDVIRRALETCDMISTPRIPTESPPENIIGYVINRGNHWLALRKIGAKWWNLDSLLKKPDLLNHFSIDVFLSNYKNTTVYYVLSKFSKATDIRQQRGDEQAKAILVYLPAPGVSKSVRARSLSPNSDSSVKRPKLLATLEKPVSTNHFVEKVAAMDKKPVGYNNLTKSQKRSRRKKWSKLWKKALTSETPISDEMFQVSKEYKPMVYRSNYDLNQFLKQRPIVNRSHRKLIDEEIEALALGLDFVPKLNPHNESEARRKELKEYKNRFNGMFRQITGYKKTEEKKKGFIEKYIPSNWINRGTDWPNDNEVMMNMAKYEEPSTHGGKLNHYRILEHVQKLQNDEAINITLSDKGGQIVIWPEIEYCREADRQLSDSDHYEEIKSEDIEEVLKSTKEKVVNLANKARKENVISYREFEGIKNRIAKASYFYIRPKTHKGLSLESKTFQGRPIVAAYDSLTYLFDKLLTTLTAPIASKIPGTCCGTSSFLQSLPKEPLPQEACIITADVISLYPSIPWDEGIQSATNYYEEHRGDIVKYFSSQNFTTNLPSKDLFAELLTCVIKNSIITFRKRKFYRQIKGTAMGVCISGFFANTFMYYLTHSIERPLFIKCCIRYYDDFFVLTTGDITEIRSFFERITNKDIKYTFSELAKEGAFLNVAFAIDDSGTLSTAPYRKPTSKPFYLHAASNHPPATIKGIPRNLLINIRRISSTEEIFLEHAKTLLQHLRLRGYNMKKLQKTQDDVQKLFRSSLLEPKKRNKDFFNTIPIIRTYNSNTDWKLQKKHLSDLHEAVIETFNDNIYHKDLAQIKASIIFKTGRKIGSYFSPLTKKGRE